MLCKHCGRECPQGSIVCPYCLKKLNRKKVWPFILIGAVLLALLGAAAWYCAVNFGWIF